MATLNRTCGSSSPTPCFLSADVMVRKMDSCMVDLVNYHSPNREQQQTASASTPHRDSAGGWLAGLTRSLSRRGGLEKRRSSFEVQNTTERSRGLDWRKSLDRLRSRSLMARKSSENRPEVKQAQVGDGAPAAGQAAVFSEWQTRAVAPVH